MPHRTTVLLLFLLLMVALPLGAQERYHVPTADSPSTGPEQAPVTVLEFIDYT
jgi:hypothetical protein